VDTPLRPTQAGQAATGADRAAEGVGYRGAQRPPAEAVLWAPRQPERRPPTSAERRSDEAEKYAQKAFDLRGNTTDSERFYITAYYHDLVTGDVPAAIETYEAWKVAYPRAWMPRWLLADECISNIGDYEKAVEEARAAVRLNPKDHDMYLRLAIALSGVGRFDDAKAVLSDHAPARFFHVARPAL